MKYTPGQLRQWAEFVTWDEPDYRKPNVKEISAQLDAHADALEERQALVDALREYMSQFGQALDAHGIPYGAAQEVADKYARAILSRIE